MGEEDLGRDFGIPPRAQVWVAHHGWCTTPRPHPSPTSRRHASQKAASGSQVCEQLKSAKRITHIAVQAVSPPCR